MRVKDVMTRSIEMIGPQAKIDEAAAKMGSLDVGMIPVLDEGEIIGIVTDRDLTVRAMAEGLDPREAPVSKVMTRSVNVCYEDDDVGQAAELMRRKQLRCLLVLDEDGGLAGVVSLGDLAVDERLMARTLRGVSEPLGAHK